MRGRRTGPRPRRRGVANCTAGHALHRLPHSIIRSPDARDLFCLARAQSPKSAKVDLRRSPARRPTRRTSVRAEESDLGEQRDDATPRRCPPGARGAAPPWPGAGRRSRATSVSPLGRDGARRGAPGTSRARPRPRRCGRRCGSSAPRSARATTSCRSWLPATERVLRGVSQRDRGVVVEDARRARIRMTSETRNAPSSPSAASVVLTSVTMRKTLALFSVAASGVQPAPARAAGASADAHGRRRFPHDLQMSTRVRIEVAS